MSIPLTVEGSAYRERVERLGLNRSELAQMLGVSTRTLRARCQEGAEVRMENLLALINLEHQFTSERDRRWIAINSQRRKLPPATG